MSGGGVARTTPSGVIARARIVATTLWLKRTMAFVLE